MLGHHKNILQLGNLVLQFALLVSTRSSELPTIEWPRLKDAISPSSRGPARLEVLSSIRESSGQIGAFAVTNLGVEYYSALAGFRDKAPRCLGNDEHPSDAAVRVILNDGSSRTTYASSGSDSDVSLLECIREEATVIKRVFEELDLIVAKLLRLAMEADPEAPDGGNPTGYRDEGAFVPLEEAPHKDHIHLYSSKKDQLDVYDQNLLVPYHTDNGIFLLLTPFPAPVDLRVKSSDGSEVSTAEFVGDSDQAVLVLVGRGLTDWLLQKSGSEMFRAVPHAVPTLVGSGVAHRAVYARMKVAPLSATPATRTSSIHPETEEWSTFEKVFRETAIGSSGSNDSSDQSSVCLGSETVGRPKRGAHDEDRWGSAMDALCQAGSAFCWMSCRPLPAECPRVEDATCFSEVRQTKCSTDPNSTVMDPTCSWHCKSDEPDDDGPLLNDFCNGAMDMIMTGFETAGTDNRNPCIVLFVSSWTLDSRAKFYVACLGVAGLGFAIEALIFFRRRLTAKLSAASRNRWVPEDDVDDALSTVSGSLRLRRHPRWQTFIVRRPWLQRSIVVSLFTLNLVLGYLAMLVAMTYSVELFLSVVAGLAAGHAVFNSGPKDSSVPESVDPCCASAAGGNCQLDCIGRRPQPTQAQTGIIGSIRPHPTVGAEVGAGESVFYFNEANDTSGTVAATSGPATARPAGDDDPVTAPQLRPISSATPLMMAVTSSSASSSGSSSPPHRPISGCCSHKNSPITEAC